MKARKSHCAQQRTHKLFFGYR